MQFDECFEGDYRIVVGALDAPRGEGYIAAVVVSRSADEDDQTPAGAADAPAVPAAPEAAEAAGSRHPAPPGRRLRAVWREVWRDDSLACGYRWPTAEAALHYARNRAREMVRNASPKLAPPPAG